MDYLYEELSESDAKILEQHLKKCKSCKEELVSLKNTSNVLQQWEDIDPKLKLVFVQEKKTLLNLFNPKLNWKPGKLQKFGFGLAMGLASLLIVMALANTRVSIKNGNFELSASLFSRQSQPSAEMAPVTEAALTEFQIQNIALFERLIQESEERRRAELARTFTELARSVDYQRNADMRLLGQGFDEVQYNTIQRLERTDQKLNDLLHYLSQQENIRK
jgi:hypothetical protein